MLRGSQKQMIVVRTRNSRMFEEAYFVMRRGAGQSENDELDMLWEANRIIESSLPHETRVPSLPTRAEGRLRRWIWFAAGLVSGSGTVGLLWFLL